MSKSLNQCHLRRLRSSIPLMVGQLTTSWFSYSLFRIAGDYRISLRSFLKSFLDEVNCEKMQERFVMIILLS
ncbi:hypothetical protein AXF42_Ash015411 [Apostasia shenzhenica]|uniref:Uncharacterized protein n=1 Tax=Apostasia shenzhenica TaxID=1088818 RepID=A0A2H9ZS56_9ASPA|nr:hypothetical protein AXF42_Ash015411 [Apostasia shenzhenica]